MPKPTFFNLPDDKRDRIVELAIDEFASHTYAEASISRMVARAGIAKGSFYQYFEDKLDLFRWLMLDVAVRRKIAFIAERPLPEATDVFALLEHSTVLGLLFGMANPRLSRVADLVFHGIPDPALAALVAEGEAMGRAYTRGLLEHAQRAGELREGLDLDLATDLVQVTLQHGVNVTMKRRFGYDLWEACTSPGVLVTDDEVRSVAADVIALLRHAIGSGRRPASDAPPLDRAALDAVMERARVRS